MRKGIVLVMCVGVLIAGTYTAYGDTIYACVHNQNGKVRIVDTPGTCHNSEYDLTWGEGNDVEQIVNTLIGRVDALEDALGIINEAPTVDCGDDTLGLLANSMSLACLVTDDGLLQPLSMVWSKVEGPGEVIFSDPNSPTGGDVWFSDTGEYVVQLSVNDGAVTVSDSVAVTIFDGNSAPTIELVSNESYYAAGPVVYSPDIYHADLLVMLTIKICDDGVPGGLDFSWAPPSITYLPEASTYIDWVDPQPEEMMVHSEVPDGTGCFLETLGFYDVTGSTDPDSVPDEILVVIPVEVNDGLASTSTNIEISLPNVTP